MVQIIGKKIKPTQSIISENKKYSLKEAVHSVLQHSASSSESAESTSSDLDYEHSFNTVNYSHSNAAVNVLADIESDQSEHTFNIVNHAASNARINIYASLAHIQCF